MRALFRLPHGHEQYNIYLGVVKSLRAVAEFWSRIFWPASRTERNGALPTAKVLITTLFFILGSLTSSLAQDKSISSEALSQIGDLLKEKRSWTPAQNKLDSQLIFAAKRGRGLFFAPDAPHIRLDVDFEKDGRIRVEIDGIITPELLKQIESGGGKVFGPHIRRSKIRALLKPSQLEELAALPEISRIRRPIKAATSTRSHR